jgi:hypothetical protein
MRSDAIGMYRLYKDEILHTADSTHDDESCRSDVLSLVELL